MAMSGMDMSPTATSSMNMAMPSSTSSSMDMSSMPMSMPMVFYTSHTTALFSNRWTPSTIGQYAGTCIFLIFLSFLLRLFYAVKCGMEARWLAQARKRRYIVTQRPQTSKDDDDESLDEDVEVIAPSLKGVNGVLTANGVTERVKIVQAADARIAQPFRISVDLARAAFVTVMVGLGYLL
ncbi:MAG: hypothetical protein Q9162_001216 [Coniocarpon cinnabarinum]